MKIRVLKESKWANPIGLNYPHLSFKEGEVVEVADELANVMVNSLFAQKIEEKKALKIEKMENKMMEKKETTSKTLSLPKKESKSKSKRSK